jgi:SMC interacting uncharacterized protein involved in chromosome segregation
MKGKLLLLTGLISIMLLPTIASATSIQTRINITNGSATVRQTINNQTIEIETNESANIFTEIKDSIVKFFVQAQGKGKVKTNFSGEYEVNITTDEKRENQSGLGIFSAIYQFLKNFLLSAWIKIPIGGA